MSTTAIVINPATVFIDTFYDAATNVSDIYVDVGPTELIRDRDISPADYDTRIRNILKVFPGASRRTFIKPLGGAYTCVAANYC